MLNAKTNSCSMRKRTRFSVFCPKTTTIVVCRLREEDNYERYDDNECNTQPQTNPTLRYPVENCCAKRKVVLMGFTVDGVKTVSFTSYASPTGSP